MSESAQMCCPVSPGLGEEAAHSPLVTRSAEEESCRCDAMGWDRDGGAVILL